MTSGLFDGSNLRGLVVRVLLLLSLAMLPIGLLSVSQTRQLANQSQESAELSLLAITQTMTADDARLLQSANGAADVLGAVLTGLRGDPTQCSRFLQGYRQVSGIYDFVGFVGTDGATFCSSSDQAPDFSSDLDALAWLSTEGHHVRVLPAEKNGDTKRVLVASAVRKDGEIAGSVAITIPVSRMSLGADIQVPQQPDGLLIFTKEGQTLARTAMLSSSLDELPQDWLVNFADNSLPGVFKGTDVEGIDRVYAVVPLVPNAVYALGIWPSETPLTVQKVTNRINLFMPIIMWVVSLVVAFLAIHRLAISHITKLGRQMHLFARNRTIPRERFDPSVPTELAQMEQSFADMTESILRDEAALEDSLRQKNILLKEVHHRVKNNLQLISSILNMQIRQARQDDTRRALERLQHRILGLATVHESLYQEGSPMLADAGALLKRIVDQMFQAGVAPGSEVETSQSYDKMAIEPDAAAPLTLLVSEAVTNALKYSAVPAEGPQSVRLSLTRDAANMARLLVENTTAPTVKEEVSGLGLKLITAFTRQLNGQFAAEYVDGWHRVTVTFPLPETPKQVLDY